MEKSIATVEVVQALCQNIFGQEKVPESTVQLCLRILGSSYGGSCAPSAGDETFVCRKIKKQLACRTGSGTKKGRATEKGLEKALRFDELHRRLTQNGVLKNRWGIFHLLSLLKEADAPPTVPVSFFETESDLPRPPPPSTLQTQNEIIEIPVNDRPLIPQTLSIQLPEEINESYTTEQELLRDVLFAFQSINGRHVKFNRETECFVVDPALGLPPSTRDLILCLCEMGWLYGKICSFANRATQIDRNGLVGQAFCFSIQEELADYYRLIAVLEAQLNQQEQESASATSGARGLTLRRLFVWTQDPAERLRLMATLLDGVGSLKGGALTSCLYMHVRHGDPGVSAFVERILRPVCVPLFSMIHRWMFEGELVDPYREFFVAQNDDIPEERLWQDKYCLRDQMLPLFIHKELGQRILVIGKSINFIRQCCGDVSWVMSVAARNLKDGHTQGLEYGDTLKLQAVVDNAAALTNTHLIDLLFGRYRLMDHLQALKKFMLLGQGDFVTFLMDMLGEELCKRASQIFHHNLTGIVESALRSSNADFDSEIIDRVNVRVLEPSPGDTGWEVFSLDYIMEGPCCAVIHTQALHAYRRVFHALWRIKRAEWSLAGAWRDHTATTHLGVNREVPELRSVFHSCALARARMLHLTSNLSNYMMFEVLETSWTTLLEHLKEAKDLDSVIKAHDQYLDKIMEKALMKESNSMLMQQLNNLLDITVQFCNTQEALFNDALAELERRKLKNQMIQSRSEQGMWGIMHGEEDDPDSNRIGGVPDFLFDQLQNISIEYEQAFTHLVKTLRADSIGSEYLRFLTFRLDFNDFYQKQLDQLEAPESAQQLPS